jgi:hypothetical protein
MDRALLQVLPTQQPAQQVCPCVYKQSYILLNTVDLSLIPVNFYFSFKEDLPHPNEHHQIRQKMQEQTAAPLLLST